MPIQATVIEDSISNENKRITTLQISLPKCLLAELNTHRALSKNAASSRAIPNSKFLTMESWEPLFWGKNQGGMQASSEVLTGDDLLKAQLIWNNAIEYCKTASAELASLGLHKQWANRLNDWHVMVDDVITGTEWDNFFNLRIHPAAQPEMDHLAKLMRKAMDVSVPVGLSRGRWHLPYVTQDERELYSIDDQLIMSTARCCRVSYNNHGGGRSTFDEDKATFDKLGLDQTIDPIHASPCEHQATPANSPTEKSGNFEGWIQHRKLIEAKLYGPQ